MSGYKELETFKDIKELADRVHKRCSLGAKKCKDYYSLGYAVSIIGYFEEIQPLISELVKLGHDIVSCDFARCDVTGYDDEYILSVYDNTLWVEPMMRKNGYIKDGSHEVFLFDDCNFDIIKHIDKESCIYKICIGNNHNKAETYEDKMETSVKCVEDKNTNKDYIDKALDSILARIDAYESKVNSIIDDFWRW